MTAPIAFQQATTARIAAREQAGHTGLRLKKCREAYCEMNREAAAPQSARPLPLEERNTGLP